MMSPSPSITRNQYLSIHIPKTAGVSIRNILKEHFGPGFVLCYWEITDAWGRVLDQVPPDATCVHGHYQTDQLTRLFPHAELITWVRDPVERVISSYHHRLRDPDPKHPVCHELHEKKLSLTEYAALPLVRNEMARYFGSKKPEDFLFIRCGSDTPKLASAWSAERDVVWIAWGSIKFAEVLSNAPGLAPGIFTGIVEEFEPSLRLMAQLLGIPAPTSRRDNVNPEKLSVSYQLDPAVRRAILAVNEQDADLYADCVRLSRCEKLERIA